MHYGYVRKSLLAGKHVFVEKPLSLKYSEAEELSNLASRNRKILMVGHLLQYHPVFARLRELTVTGALGDLNYIYSNRLSLGKIRGNEDVIWSFAPHDISMILSLTGQLPVTVYAGGSSFIQEQITDMAIIDLEFKKGIKSHIFVSWLHPYKRHQLVVVGDRKMAVFDDTAPWPDKLVIFEYEIDRDSGVPKAIRGDAIKIDVDEKEPLKEECRHFIDCIEKNKKPLTDGEEGLRVLKVLEAAKRSMDKGDIVDV